MASTKKKVSAHDKVREAAEADLYTFARLVSPHRVYGQVHKELFEWWTRPTAKDHQLCLLPRDHQKSHCAAVRAAWEITRDPSITILYLSATATLAEKQLYAIKNILESDIYRTYWPEMINPEEGKRARWTVNEIIVDHPKRRDEGIRDATITAGGITMNITGLHANMVFLDDMVVPNNAYTEEMRRKVEATYSQIASIETTGAKEVVVGTRYHPKDLYNTIVNIEEEIFDENDELIGTEPVYEVFEKVVEENGIFLWPKERRPDGKTFGFDLKELARKKAKYVDTTQFYAQYYNNPNALENAQISRDKFQYYDRKHLLQRDGYWYFKDSKLNVFAAIDFAFSIKKKADFTAIVIIGVDADKNYYVLDIDRFKTDGKISVYFKHILETYVKWGYKKLRAEVTVAQQAVVKELKETYFKEHGLPLKVDEYRPSRHEGNKQERMAATLEPKYDNQQIWHYKGGLCTTLEEELLLSHPDHDDIKDALTAAIDVAVAPSRTYRQNSQVVNISTHSRFGGVY